MRSASSSPPSRGSRFAVVQANAISPEPCEPCEPVRARPTNGRRASRRSWCGSSGASVATRQRHEPSPLDAASPASSTPDGPAAEHEALGQPEVRQHEHADACARPRRARRCRCPPRSRTSPCRRRRRPAPRRPRRPRRRRAPAATSASSGSGPSRTSHHSDGSHSPTTGMITSSRPMRGSRAVSTRVAPGVDGAHVGRGREEDGRLLVAPFLDRVRARQLARAVQRRRRAEVRRVPRIARVRPDRRHAGVIGHVRWRGRRARPRRR